jgi:hypothetical protein
MFRSFSAIISSLVTIIFWKYSIAFSMPSFEAINRAFSGSKTSILSDLGDISTTFLISKNTKYYLKTRHFLHFFKSFSKKTGFPFELCRRDSFQHQHQFWPADLGLVSFDLGGWKSAFFKSFVVNDQPVTLPMK